jgi:hypothetical protein
MSACGWGIIAATFTVGLFVGANVGFLALGLFVAARDEGYPSRDGEVSPDRHAHRSRSQAPPLAVHPEGHCESRGLGTASRAVPPDLGTQNPPDWT